MPGAVLLTSKLWLPALSSVTLIDKSLFSVFPAGVGADSIKGCIVATVTCRPGRTF